MRGLLSKERLLEIDNSIPEISLLCRRIIGFMPNAVALFYGPESDMPIAIVCLQDSAEYLQEARYALHACMASIIWHREERTPPNEVAGIFEGRFYADDTALRLYSAAEHLASFIQEFLSISDDDLEPYRKARISKASILGHFLLKEMPNHQITHSVQELLENESWRFTTSYRNKWVHDQRPRLKGMEIVFDRRDRWLKADTTKHMLFGGGDEPSLTIDELVEYMCGSFIAFARVLGDVSKNFVSQVEGLETDEEGNVKWHVGSLHWETKQKEGGTSL